MPGPPPLPIIVDPSWLGALIDAVAKALGLKGGGGALGTGGTGTPGSPGNPLTLAQAEAVFKEMAGKPYIPFNWPRDGCYARAHEMRRLMAADGIEARKVFNYASPTGTGLEVKGTSIGDVQWGYHVAPIIAVKGSDGVVRDMVIDPSLGNKLVTVDEWKGKQGDPASIIEKADGSVMYKPQGMSDSDPAVMKDDDYKKTDAALENFRRERAIWDTGVDPATGLPHK